MACSHRIRPILTVGISENSLRRENLNQCDREIRFWEVCRIGTENALCSANQAGTNSARVTDATQLQRLAAVWKSKLDWDFEVGDGAFRDADGRDGLVFGVAATKILAFAKEPYSQTRYR